MTTAEMIWMLIRSAKNAGVTDENIVIILRPMTLVILKKENCADLTENSGAYRFGGYEVEIGNYGPKVRTKSGIKSN